MAETTDTTPNAQAYDNVVEELRGRFAPNIANIRLFKDNPYLSDMTEEDRVAANEKLLTPFHGEQFYDDDKYVYVCQYEYNEAEGKTEYKYYSKEKDLSEKMDYYESQGVLNQLMSAYNNGKVYCFYVDRDNSMMYPTSELVFPYNFASYTVRKQQLSSDKNYIYVAGTLIDGEIQSDIYMKPIKDTVAGTEYRKMSPASLFNSTDNKTYDMVEHGKFYVVDFFNEDHTLVDTVLFQAVDAAVEDVAIPSQSVVGLDVQILRGELPQTATGDNYPIISGEDTSLIQYNVIAIYNDGTRKNITSYVNTNHLVITGTENLNSSAEIGSSISINFTYYPNLDDYGEPIGTPVTKTVTFTITANNLSTIEKIIPVVWTDQVTGAGNTKSYKVKIYSINNEGYVENRTKAFFDTMKVYDSSNNTLKDCEYPYTYNSSQQYVLFAPRTVWEDTTFSFSLYSGNVKNEYRFIAAFSSGNATGIYMKPLTNTNSYGYKSGDPLGTYGDSVENTATYYIGNQYLVFKSDVPFSNRYKITRDGEIIKPNAIQLFLVNDSTMQPITLETSFPTTDTSIRLGINSTDSGITSLVSGIKANDYIIAKFNNSTNDVCTAIDIFRITYNV